MFSFQIKKFAFLFTWYRHLFPVETANIYAYFFAKRLNFGFIHNYSSIIIIKTFKIFFIWISSGKNTISFCKTILSFRDITIFYCIFFDFTKQITSFTIFTTCLSIERRIIKFNQISSKNYIITIIFYLDMIFISIVSSNYFTGRTYFF